MQSTKLVQYLSLLQKDEYKPFRRFLVSPYHNRQKELISLFDLIIKHLFCQNPKSFGEIDIARLLFPSEPFNQNKFRKLCTSLLHCTSEFFKHERLKNEPVRGDIFLLRRFNESQSNRFFHRRLESANQNLAKSTVSLSERSDLAVAIGMEAYKYEMRLPSRRPDTNLGNMISHLEKGYTIRKMKLIYAQLNHFRITGKGNEFGDENFLRNFATYLEQMPTEAVMYYHLYLCTTYPQRIKAYEKLRVLLRAKGGQLFMEELEDLYNGAINYCARGINRGIPKFQRDIWELYQEMIDQGILGAKGSLLKAHFKNMMVIASRLGEFEWAKRFLKDHQTYIIGNHNQNGIHFGKGVISYYEGNLDEAGIHFYKVLEDYEDIFFGLDARGYLLRIHYETGNTVSLESLCDSYRMFLKRNKELPGRRKANYNHFVNCMRRLARIPDFEKERLLKLKKDIEEGRRIANTGWLLAKVDESLEKVV